MLRAIARHVKSPYFYAALFVVAYLMMVPSHPAAHSSMLGVPNVCADEGENGSCKPKTGWVCSTPRADYLDMCWVSACS